MDDLDRKLITLLRHDGRRSISDLAADLGLTRATVRARLEKLEQSGEIIGFTVILRSDAIDLPVRGITMIEIAGQAADTVIDALSGFTEVSSIHTTNGNWAKYRGPLSVIPVDEYAAISLAKFTSM